MSLVVLYLGTMYVFPANLRKKIKIKGSEERYLGLLETYIIFFFPDYKKTFFFFQIKDKQDDITDTTISSSISIDSKMATEDDTLCTCSGLWDVKPELYTAQVSQTIGIARKLESITFSWFWQFLSKALSSSVSVGMGGPISTCSGFWDVKSELYTEQVSKTIGIARKLESFFNLHSLLFSVHDRQLWRRLCKSVGTPMA